MFHRTCLLNSSCINLYNTKLNSFNHSFIHSFNISRVAAWTQDVTLMNANVDVCKILIQIKVRIISKVEKLEVKVIMNLIW